ncbi:putative diguanylate cyclase AdrA [Acaryochloris thomasi RCC1774]|uniref:Putative diguanylate cyclase AdrA n=1 Tax=Acaryochloris thomasi RCC1774 TaxID=1764569 RepID=A0A2W1JUI2_9CYAN|nr:diguanylate cyclase [Acaryochloris thomasi]PZD74152.1 putative diguanylate cyclase AdrA [Acaryochloris thomasi RCC1774]
MSKWFNRPISVRNRLLTSIGSMLIPVVVLAVGTIGTFNLAFSSFEETEAVILHESFPAADLELLLIRVSLLAASIETVEASDSQSDFEQLSQQIDQTLRLLKHEEISGVPERFLPPGRENLVTAINTQWLEARASGTEFFKPTSASELERQRKTRQIFIRDIEKTVTIIHRLNHLLNSWQDQNNLMQAKEVSRKGLILLVIICGIALSLAITTVWALSKTILGPLQILEQAISRFSNGELSHRIELQTQDELAQLAQTFNQMATKLEQSQADLQTLATIDGLTGVYNRREFNRWLHIEIEQARRESHSLSLVMVDIDYFKRLNDKHGHQSGDIALRWIGALLSENVRPGDIVARYGGEEFAIILPQTTEIEALVIAERIRQSIETQPVEVLNQQLLYVTASLGLATFPEETRDEEELLRQADCALYRAKQAGRNQVQHAGKIPV